MNLSVSVGRNAAGLPYEFSATARLLLDVRDRRAIEVRTRFVEPAGCVGIIGEIQEPPEESESIVASQSKPSGVGRKAFCEGPGVVEDTSDAVGDDLGHCPGVLSVGEQIGSDPRRPRHGQPTETNPFRIGQRQDVEADVRPPGLAPLREGELMAIRGKMAEAVEGCCGPERHHPLLGAALPSRDARGELEPCGAQLQVLRDGSPAQPVHAMGHPFERRAWCRKPVESRLGDPHLLCLSARDEAPLLLGEVC